MNFRVCLFFVLSLCVCGQQPVPKLPKFLIEKVTIISKSGQNFSAEQVKSLMSLREGKFFTLKNRKKDLNRLNEKAIFENIKIEVIQTGLSSVAIEVSLSLIPTVREVIIKGNKYNKTDFLLKKLKMYQQLSLHSGFFESVQSFEEGSFKSTVLLDYTLVAQDKNILYTHYVSKGFNDVKITHTIEKDEKANEVKVIYNIDEGKHSKVDSITFYGNSFYTNKQLVSTMEGRPSLWRYIFGAGYLNGEILEIDYQNIERVYIGEGFLDFEFVDVKKVYSRHLTYVHLDIIINEGRRYEIGKISLTGNTVVSVEELSELITIKEGDFFRRNDIIKTLTALRRPYGSKGYVDLQIIQKEEERNGVIDLIFEFKEGDASRVNDIHIIGNKVTRDFVIRRELSLHPDDISNSTEVAVSERRLRGTGFFQEVSILPTKSEVDNKRNLNVKVKEALTGAITLGVGASDADQVSVNFSLSESNFSLRKPYRGDGQRFQFQASASNQRNNFNIFFTEPWLFNERISYTFNAFRNQRFLDRYDRTKVGFSNSLRSQVPGTEYWQQTIQHRFEKVTIDNILQGASPQIRAEETHDFVSAVQLTYRRNTSNRGSRPTSGTDFSLIADWQPSFLGSANNVYSLSASFKKFWQPTSKTILRFRSTLSSVNSYGEGRVAIYNRYTAGGLADIRGYDFRDVSPVDFNEDSLGGNSLFTGSLELEFPLKNSQQIAIEGDILPVDKAWIRGVLFSDFGNVWTDSYDWQFDNINVTIGIGFRIDIPAFGTMVLDFAKPVQNKLSHTRGGEVHFNFGYNF